MKEEYLACFPYFLTKWSKRAVCYFSRLLPLHAKILGRQANKNISKQVYIFPMRIIS